MKPDDIISYHDLVSAEKANLQKGMNFGVGGDYSVVLMSVREGAPYADEVDPATGNLIYEGHDVPKTKDNPIPKIVDQPMLTPGGKWTENGKFWRAAVDFNSGLRKHAELVKVYEKITRGIWCYKGFFELIQASQVKDKSGKRQVFKFQLRPVERKALGKLRGNKIVKLPHNRLIPTEVKLEVWRRDHGKCVQCGATENLHFDHNIPFSRGGTSLKAENIQLLCAKHNLRKSDKIIALMPWVVLVASGME